MFWGTLNFSVTFFLVRPFSKSLRVKCFSLIVRTVFLLHYIAMCSSFCYVMKCNAKVSSFFLKHFAMQWYISFSWSFKIVVSMDLVSMAVNNKEPLEIILLKNFEIQSTVMGCHVYWNNWGPVMGEVLKTCMELQNKVDSIQWLLLKMRTMLLVIQKGKVENLLKQYFTFWKLITLCHIKITGKAVNVGDYKRMRVPPLLQFTRIFKMMNILQEPICKL